MNAELLREIAVFVEVARARSFTKAAGALSLPKSTVSRRVAGLERAVGIRLLKRTTQRVELTDEGLRYFARCQRIVEEAELAHEELADTRQHVRGHLRIAASADFGLRLIAGLPAFCRHYPELSLHFDFTPRRVDPLTENCELAIYVGSPPDSSLTAHKLADLSTFVYAAPSYLRGRKAPATPADLAAHECIRKEKPDSGGLERTWTLVRGRQRVEAPVDGHLSMNSIGIMRRLAAQGLGIAVLPEGLAREDVDAERLVRVLIGWSAPALPIYALTASRLMPAKTRAFIDFLQGELQPRKGGPDHASNS